MLTRFSIGDSSYATAQEKVQASERQKHEDDVAATIGITTSIRGTIPLKIPDFSEEQVRQALSMIPTEVTNMRCWFCRVPGYSVYKCACLSLRQQRYCAYQSYLSRQKAATPPQWWVSREITTPRRGYWPRGGEEQRAYGLRRQAASGDQRLKVLLRKEPNAGVEDRSDAKLAVPNEGEMPAPRQV